MTDTATGSIDTRPYQVRRARKAMGTPESAHERVKQFIQALRKLRDAFATGGEAFLDTESDWARQLAATDPDRGAGNSHQSGQ
ncbi:hypothetical protein [Rhodococcus pyridinivorans]|uniref:hypothetical protein n=1 Tax=Rhodococcus pyridinivorans TaxID=103816 RepID=UPI002657DECC|nr:hypothetical protein [Rhodococcus pyridinivorans]